MSYSRFGAARGFCRIAAAAVVLLSCVSCTQMERVSHPDVEAQLLLGHELRITTIEGQVFEFRLLQVTEDALVGQFHEVRFDEIASVERRDFSLWKTGCLVGGGVAGVVGCVILVILDLAEAFDESI